MSKPPSDVAHALDNPVVAVTLNTMTPRQIEIIQSSFAALRPIPDRVGARFYYRLFEMAPETRAMFKSDMAEQRRKLVETLGVVVEALDRIETVLPTIRDLAIRHRAYGVEDDHYSLVGLALLETLREMLGAAFDGELEQAWRDAYGLVAETMIEASHDRFKMAGSRAGSLLG